MASIKLIRMNGLGNDFLIYDKRNSTELDENKIFSNENILQLCSRKNKATGGCDQFIILHPQNNNEVFMRVFNSDSSEVFACGNATRCVVALMDKNFSGNNIAVKTKSDILNGVVFAKNSPSEFMVSVNMGKPIFDWKKIPLAENVDYKNLPISLDGFSSPFAVSMGNPHMVFTTEAQISQLDIPAMASPLEFHPLFPERVNVGFAEIISQHEINLRVYERGAGETLACGTGACAAVVACINRGLTERKVNVNTRGGKMIVEQNSSGEIIMTGPAIFEKEILLDV